VPSRFQDKGPLLLRVAREAIDHALGLVDLSKPEDLILRESAASFVTLTLNDELRGCIGSIEAYRPLLEDLRHNAVAAAFEDPRFPPLTREEFSEVRIEVTLLSPLEEMAFLNEKDALSQLRPNVDGVVLSYLERRATFLPQVWEQLPRPEDFLSYLKKKAGLSPDFWSPDLKLFRYGHIKFEERA